VYACDCSDPSLQEISARADVIFRGTIVALRPSTGTQGFGDTFDTGKIAVFHVVRVWKGKLGPTFEMPAVEETSACWGFWPSLLKVGNDLLVFAFRIPNETTGTFLFETTICSRTAPAKGNRDLEELGAGSEPAKSPQAMRYGTLVPALVTLIIVAMMAYLIQARAASWNQQRRPPL
jgi:hypothetical protein